jgi:hypothetical protein
VVPTTWLDGRVQWVTRFTIGAGHVHHPHWHQRVVVVAVCEIGTAKSEDERGKVKKTEEDADIERKA